MEAYSPYKVMKPTPAKPLQYTTFKRSSFLWKQFGHGGLEFLSYPDLPPVI